MHRNRHALVLTLVPFLLLRVPRAQAQTTEASVFAGAGGYANGSGSGSVGSFGVAFEVLVMPQLSLNGEFSFIYTAAAPTASVSLRLQTTKRQRFVPFVLAGLSRVGGESSTHTYRCYGGGLLLWPTRSVGLRLEYRGFARTSGEWEHVNLARVGVVIR
jgi:hypothetical protein